MLSVNAFMPNKCQNKAKGKKTSEKGSLGVCSSPSRNSDLFLSLFLSLVHVPVALHPWTWISIKPSPLKHHIVTAVMENLRALEYENITTHFSECPVPVRDSSVCAGMGEFCKDMIEFSVLHFHLLTAQ